MRSPLLQQINSNVNHITPPYRIHSLPPLSLSSFLFLHLSLSHTTTHGSIKAKQTPRTHFASAFRLFDIEILQKLGKKSTILFIIRMDLYTVQKTNIIMRIAAPHGIHVSVICDACVWNTRMLNGMLLFFNGSSPSLELRSMRTSGARVCVCMVFSPFSGD